MTSILNDKPNNISNDKPNLISNDKPNLISNDKPNIISNDKPNINIIVHNDNDDNIFLLDKHDKLISNLENNLKMIIHNRDGITLSNLVYIISDIMVVISKYKQLSGPEKKSIILLIITKAIENNITDESLKLILLVMMETAMLEMIDLLISINKGDINFNYNKFKKCIIWLKNKLQCKSKKKYIK